MSVNFDPCPGSSRGRKRKQLECADSSTIFNYFKVTEPSAEDVVRSVLNSVVDDVDILLQLYSLFNLDSVQFTLYKQFV